MTDGACVTAARLYSADDYYLRIYNLDRLDYGWRVGDITLHTNCNDNQGQKYSAVAADVVGDEKDMITLEGKSVYVHVDGFLPAYNSNSAGDRSAFRCEVGD
jgi:hypothetical protein